MFVLGEGPMRLTFVQRLPELDGRLWGGTQLHGAVIHPREGCGLRGLHTIMVRQTNVEADTLPVRQIMQTACLQSRDRSTPTNPGGV